jgi:flagellin
MARLSSGMRINSGADDASGLAIATKMDSQIRGMNVAIRNSNDAISFAQTADGGLSSVTDSLQRMRELAVQGANGTTDNASLAAEFGQLQSEITRVTGNTNFNGTNTLGAAAATGLTFQVGAGTTANDSVTVTGVDLTAAASDTAKSAAAAIKVDTVTNAQAAITQIDLAIKEVNGARATYGAVSNRFTSIVSNLQASSQNQSAAKSRIMDTDFAAETANLTRAQILQQAGTAMLAQANSQPNGVLALLRG